jgi:hypothetical protein
MEVPVLPGNQWNLAASSPILTMNSVGSAFVPLGAGMGGGDEPVKLNHAEVKWYHAFALKGFPVLDAVMNKGQPNNVNSKKTTVFYYEVRIVDSSFHYQ